MVSAVYDNPSNQHFRSVAVSERGGQHVFTKTYHQLSSDEVYAIYDKYRYLEQHLDREQVIVPRAFECDGQTITFEYLKLSEEYRLNNLLKDGGEALSQAVPRAAVALAHFHTACQESEYIHGDFWGGNVFVLPEHVVLIDCEFPPLPHSGFCERVYEEPYRSYVELDIAYFIRHSIIRHNSTWQMYWQVLTPLHKEFLTAYLAAGGTYDQKRLNACIRATCRSCYHYILNSGTYPWYKQGPHMLMWTITILRNRYLRRAFIGF